MTILARACQVAIETEATAGTAETLVAADVHFRVRNPSFNIAADVHLQDMLSADLSELQDLVGNLPVDISFETIISGQGVVDTATGWSEILIHGGFDETVNASTSVSYLPETPATTAPATIGMWFGAASGSSGRLFIAKGCRPSSMNFAFAPGQPVVMTTTWRGAFSSAADASAFASVTYDTTFSPVAKSLGMTIGSWTPLLKSFNLNITNGLGQVDNPGAASESSGISHYVITSRRVDGDIAFLEPLVATKDYVSDIGNGTLAALTMTLGGTSANKVQFDCPKFQLLPGSQTNFEDLLGASIAWKANRNAGDDELSITTL